MMLAEAVNCIRIAVAAFAGDLMRFALVALVALAAGCGKQPADAAAPEPKAAFEAAPAVETAAPAEDLWPEGFPKPVAEYAGVYDFNVGDTALEVKIAASGVTQRLAFPPGSGIGGARGAWSQIMINENAGEKMLMWPEGDGAPQIATLMSKSDLGAMASAIGIDDAAQARAKRTGADEVAGEKCAIWEIAAASDSDAAGSACVTRDGIPLRVVSGGKIVMLAKSIARGPQDPALFAPPAGYEVFDMGECMRIGAEMMEAMRSGKTPDMAKMEKCRALGEKMGAMMGDQ
jgi:hypothetical protein